MTKEEYKLKIYELEKKYKNDQNQIKIEYALSNNPYKIGQIIESYSTRIKIKKIEVTHNFSIFPECYFKGISYTKKNKPYKKNNIDGISQSSVKKVIEE